MNFDESSGNEDNVEEEQTRSLSPHADSTRPASASSGKDVAVRSPSNQLPKKTHSCCIISNPKMYIHCMLHSTGSRNARIAHSRQLPDRCDQPGGVCPASSSSWNHHQMSDQSGQEGNGPWSVSHLLHAHGERRREEGESDGNADGNMELRRLASPFSENSVSFSGVSVGGQEEEKEQDVQLPDLSGRNRSVTRRRQFHRKIEVNANFSLGSILMCFKFIFSSTFFADIFIIYLVHLIIIILF